jgi:16S rRNA (cytidine1402-2'-O)-methyltransferase
MVELGDRDAALCRELTKAHETIYRGSLSQLQAFVRNDVNQQRGEMVLVIRGCDAEAVQLSAEAEAIARSFSEGASAAARSRRGGLT